MTKYVVASLECVRTEELESYLKEQEIKFTIKNPTVIKLQIDNKLVPIITDLSRNTVITDVTEVLK